MTVSDFSIEYDAINSRNTFTNGDTINGRIIVAVSEETKIDALLFIAQGRADVRWHEHYGQHYHHVYWSDEKYYDVKHPILRAATQNGAVCNPLCCCLVLVLVLLLMSRCLTMGNPPGTEVISKGRHVFPFSFKIPDRY